MIDGTLGLHVSGPNPMDKRSLSAAASAHGVGSQWSPTLAAPARSSASLLQFSCLSLETSGQLSTFFGSAQWVSHSALSAPLQTLQNPSPSEGAPPMSVGLLGSTSVPLHGHRSPHAVGVPSPSGSGPRSSQFGNLSKTSGISSLSVS